MRRRLRRETKKRPRRVEVKSRASWSWVRREIEVLVGGGMEIGVALCKREDGSADMWDGERV